MRGSHAFKTYDADHSPTPERLARATVLEGTPRPRADARPMLEVVPPEQERRARAMFHL